MLQSLTYPPRPTLDPLQLRFLEEIARQWRAAGEWPRTEKTRLRLRGELDFDRVGSTVRGELSQPIEDPDRRLHQTRLTVAGLEYVTGGASEVAPFVAAVRAAAQDYAAAGHARLVVDRPDLQRWFPEAPDSHGRLLELYRLDWSGGYTRLPGGGFSSDLYLDHVRLLDAETGWDLVARLANRGRYAGDVEQGELELLRAVYDRWHATGHWPSLREIVLANPSKPAALELLQNLPLKEPRLLETTAVSGTSDRELRLTLFAVARVAPGQEADLFARMLGVLASHYIRTEGEGSIETVELARLLGATANELARACELGRLESSGVGFGGAEGRGRALLSPGIDRWEGVKSYEDYQRAIAAERRSRIPQPAVVTLPGPEHPARKELGSITILEPPPRHQFDIPGVPTQHVRVSLPNGEWSYDARDELGHGGMATVFSGTGSDGTPVAIKVFHDRSAGTREMRVADAFLQGRDRKHSMPVLDVGVDDSSGDYIIVMPLAETDLEKYLEKGAVAEPEAVEILEEILAALEEVGDEIVHRDLKPGNVLRHEGRWKLSDFGLARWADAKTSSSTKRSWWSEEYAAPEQWRSERPSKATDVYALGCIGYRLLTGKPPFTGSMDELAEHHQHSLPPRLQASAPLRGVLASCLSKHPQQRPSLSAIRIALAQAHSANAGTLTAAQVELLEAGAAIAREQAEEERRQLLAANESRQDAELKAGAVVYVEGLFDRFFREVLQRVDQATQTSKERIRLGQGLLKYEQISTEPGKLPLSGWEILAGFRVELHQSGQDTFSANLWYARLPGKTSYEWFECSVVPVGELAGAAMPQSFHIGNPELVDQAIERHAGGYRLREAPVPIDAEHETEFVERWMSRLAKASLGRLRDLFDPTKVVPDGAAQEPAVTPRTASSGVERPASDPDKD